jgi:hypothetical protein
VDDLPASKLLSGPEFLSPIFFAEKVRFSGENSAGAEIYRVNRFVFHPAGSSGAAEVSPNR